MRGKVRARGLQYGKEADHPSPGDGPVIDTIEIGTERVGPGKERENALDLALPREVTEVTAMNAPGTHVQPRI